MKTHDNIYQVLQENQGNKLTSSLILGICAHINKIIETAMQTQNQNTEQTISVLRENIQSQGEHIKVLQEELEKERKRVHPIRKTK
jgi:hypothetical protein